MLETSRIAAIVPVSDLDAAVRFYEGTLGLRLVERRDHGEFAEAEFDANGTTLVAYVTGSAGQAGHTLAGFRVDDLDAAMEELRGRGVTFEDYDLPGLKTEGGVAQLGDARGAWFRDPDGNILAVEEG